MEFDGQLIFLLLFVLISGIKWFVEQVKNKGQKPHDVSEDLEEIYDDFREQIRRRQTELQDPIEEQVPHHARENTPPPLPVAAPVQQEYIPDPLPQVRKVKRPQLSAAEQAALANLQQRSRSGRNTRSKGQQNIRDLLSSPQSAQQAILLHEILGKPKSLQS
ncbi:hypothetical protein HW115_10525 [Verrucomicrobiaceae bacterium N1E253]|uniref:Uncharacterized protein n=1 Tax=Oceaniferula marina TaxID=2748318 RepID=A0A851GLV3_9BACT|nr:hypothetical protein [Oceaniferula marina]NWK56047.1 hypothetical protein [Oceaniferula marina]